jgi:hypothetical protein
VLGFAVPPPVLGAAGVAGAGVFAGGVVVVEAGGVVLCVVVLSAPPLLLQAARLSNASAETDAMISFFISSLLSLPSPKHPLGRVVEREMVKRKGSCVTSK